MLALLLLASLSPAYSQPVEEDWERVRSEPERLKLNGTCFGPEGEIIVATKFGIRPDKEGGLTINVTDLVKYDRRGEELWTRRRTDFVRWVLGLACGPSGAIALSNARVTSLYGPDGTVRWTSLRAPERSGWFSPQNIAVDSENSVLISFAATAAGRGDGTSFGKCDDPESGEDGDRYDIVVLKYGAEGELLWEHVYDGGSFDFPTQVGTDAADNVYVAAATSSSVYAPDYDFLVIKLDSLGNRLWAERYDGGFNQYDFPVAMAVEPDGSVYVTGRSFGASCDYLTMRIDTAGNQEWSARFDGAGLYDVVKALAVDPWGGVHVTGLSLFRAREVSAGGTETSRAKYTIGTVSYDARGSERWASLFSRDFEFSSNEHPTDITVDQDGDAYVAASVLGWEPRKRFLAVKYALEADSPAGEILWTEWREVGTPEAINVDRKKNVFVVSKREPGDMAIVKGDVAILKYAPAMFIRGDVNGDGHVPGSVSDAVYLLLYSFVGGPEPECWAAADVDGDGRVGGSVSDAVYLLNHLFLGGLPPETPYPDCGPGSLSSDIDLGCAKSLGECL